LSESENYAFACSEAGRSTPRQSPRLCHKDSHAYELLAIRSPGSFPNKTITDAGLRAEIIFTNDSCIAGAMTSQEAVRIPHSWIGYSQIPSDEMEDSSVQSLLPISL
jgi:hypothetical protein